MDAKPPEKSKATDYLANERTFLAWVRTSISILTLGFVVAKFGVWLRELASRLTPGAPIPGTGLSLPMGIGMMIFGGFLVVLAARNYNNMNAAIERNDVRPTNGLILFVTIAVVVLAAIMIAYMLLL